MLSEFFKHFPANTDLKHIWLKVSVLNDLYSTNIFDTYAMAKHILRLKIDRGLKAGSHKMVDRIAMLQISGKKWKFYSFASKYCNWHNNEDYAIYDKYVDRILREYKKQYRFSDFKTAALKDYPKFMAVQKQFRDYFHLTQYTYKQIDRFLWLHGKELFNNR